MQLPRNLPLDQMQTRWASLINPVLANILLSGNYIPSVVLLANTPQQINTGLSRLQTGYFIVDQNASANVYRTQAFNEKTLTLESSATVTISLWVF